MTDDNDFEALMRELEKTEKAVAASLPKIGEQIHGTIIALNDEQVFVDVGGKAEASMDIANLRDRDGVITAAVGDQLTAVVTGVDVENSTLVLGTRDATKPHSHEELEAAYQHGLPVEGVITGTIKGGVEVQLTGYKQRAFCPASQVDIRFIEDLSTLVGERCAFRITKFEGGRRINMVVSRRALLQEEQEARATATREQLKEGAVMSGTVTGMKDFGAFIDLGGIEGMVHISELPWAVYGIRKRYYRWGRRSRSRSCASNRPVIRNVLRRSPYRSAPWPKAPGPTHPIVIVLGHASMVGSRARNRSAPLSKSSRA